MGRVSRQPGTLFVHKNSMKHFITIAVLELIISGTPLVSQTQAIEQGTLMNKYTSKELTQPEFKDLAIAWRNLTDSIGYPEVPYDTVTGRVEYEFIYELDGIPRDIIVNRVSEWAAISYGITDNILTHQGNTGSRLILNGSFEILFPDLFFVWKNSWKGYVTTEQQNSGAGYFTLIFTIRDGKLKVQALNISYDYTDNLSGQSVSRTLESCFPISNNDQDEWKAILSIVNATRENLVTQMNSLVGYIKDYENDYTW
jgi:hypothetical protein